MRQSQLFAPSPANCNGAAVSAHGRIREVRVHERPAVVELRIRLHDVVAQSEVERKTRCGLEVVLHPERIALEAAGRGHLRVLDDRRRVQLAQQVARIGVAGRRQERACRAEPGGLHVAEAEGRQAPVRALALFGLEALPLEPERDRVPAERRLEVVLDRVVVQELRERARVGAAPLRRRVRDRQKRSLETLNPPRQVAGLATPPGSDSRRRSWRWRSARPAARTRR